MTAKIREHHSRWLPLEYCTPECDCVLIGTTAATYAGVADSLVHAD